MATLDETVPTVEELTYAPDATGRGDGWVNAEGSSLRPSVPLRPWDPVFLDWRAVDSGLPPDARFTAGEARALAAVLLAGADWLDERDDRDRDEED